MRITRKILSRVEGEVELRLRWKDGVIEDAYVIAPSYRGFEKILEGKPVWDALVIASRVCGICGHAHLIAAVRAMEDVYRRFGVEIRLSDKAEKLRTLTLLSEIVQNHIRWFYLYLLPDFLKIEPSLRELYEPMKGRKWREALSMSNLAVKIIALFGGQWPHTSYAIPGGVTSDPTGYEINTALSLVDKLIEFFEREVFSFRKGTTPDPKTYLKNVGGDIGRFVELSFSLSLDREGRSYGRFVAGGRVEPCFTGGIYVRRACRFDPSKVKELEDFSFFSGKGYTWAKAVRYNGLPYETGPLGRQLVLGNKIIRELYRNYKDSAMVRVIARMEEAYRLLLSMREILKGIDLAEPSWIKPPVDTSDLSGEGIGIVEAARGTLIHRIEVERGRIRKYDIITPTVWNLGPRDQKNLGVAEKAIVGLDSELKAHIVLRSFDVCSVCTSH